MTDPKQTPERNRRDQCNEGDRTPKRLGRIGPEQDEIELGADERPASASVLVALRGIAAEGCIKQQPFEDTRANQNDAPKKQCAEHNPGWHARTQAFQALD
ncbi:hypothetical protein D3C71_1180880 [compost metagenome]